ALLVVLLRPRLHAGRGDEEGGHGGRSGRGEKAAHVDDVRRALEDPLRRAGRGRVQLRCGAPPQGRRRRGDDRQPEVGTQLVLGQVLNGAIIGAMYGIIALGITLTFGITGIVNFALGEFMMIGAYATYTLAERLHLPYAVAVGPACLIAAAAGYLSNKAF